MRVAVVTTVKDEEADILKFLRAMEAQTRKPDLFVLVVSPGTDRTREIVGWWAETTFLETDIQVVPCNRSVGRNIGIQYAIREGADVIALTNVCEPEPSWLEMLVMPIESTFCDCTDPLEHPPQVDVVGGSWILDTRSNREDAMGLLTQFSQDQLNEERLSALNMAVRADTFADIGMFDPELDTSEDTEFVQRLVGKSEHVIKFQPGAVVKWRPSTLTLRGAVKAFFQFAKTDGKAGLLFPEQYGPTYLAYLFIAVPAILGVPVLSGLLLFGWLAFRVRKVINNGLLEYAPYTMATALGIDIARVIGYAIGKHSRSE